MGTVTININLDAKCKRCRKGGATPSGLCLKCIGKAISAGEFDHILKKHNSITDASAAVTEPQQEERRTDTSE